MTIPSHPDNADDRALVARLAAGDHAAMETIVARHGGYLLSYSRRLLSGDATAAEDLVQHCWLKLLTAPPPHTGSLYLRAWLTTVATNRATDHHRRVQRLRLDAWDEATHDHRAAESWELTEAWQGAAHVRVALHRLPLALRLPLLLFYAEGLDCAAIGAALGIGPLAVKSRLYRGRQFLRAALSEQAATLRASLREVA